jgi:hypothetical protein
LGFGVLGFGFGDLGLVFLGFGVYVLWIRVWDLPIDVTCEQAAGLPLAQQLCLLRR